MSITYDIFSEAGQRRINQDACEAINREEHSKALFVLCDGMCGHAMGEIASRTVCSVISSYWSEHSEEPDSKEKYIAACRSSSSVLDSVANRLGKVEMGTTLVMAAIESSTLTVVHCGDSRCYLLRNGSVVFQTQDHINPDWGMDFVSRCFISYNPEAASPEIERFNLEKGDRIFLCSDGVYKATSPEILTARLTDDKPLYVINDTIKFLCEKFSDDNYTGILIQIN